LKKVGLKYFTSIIWYKGNIGKIYGKAGAENPFIRDDCESIIVGYKKRWKKFRKGVSDITRQEYGQFSSNFWQIPPAKKSKTKHPAAFPPELAERCIKLFSYTKDTVYDPFSGSGTTCLVAEKMNRRWIGTDIGKEYVVASRKRMKDLIGNIWYTFDLD
jgi:site-specific DNA-methyltransferase (adenine-specific)